MLTKEYQRDLPNLSWQAGAMVQTLPISQHGQDGVAGVINENLIPFLVTSNAS